MTKKNNIKISIFKKADGLAGIWQTMYLMRELVYRSKHNRLIKKQICIFNKKSFPAGLFETSKSSI